MPPETLYQSDQLRILCHNPQAEHAVVVFDHRQVRDGNFATIRPSDKITKAGFSYITVASKRNDWFLSPSLSDCHEQVSAYMAKYRRVVGFGSSMGGFGALAMSRTFRFKQVLVVSPQITVFPDRAPFDPRFKEHAKELDPTFDTVSQHPRKGLGGVILFDPNQPNDLAHAQIISELFPRLRRVPMSFAGHPALKLISQAKGFHRIQDELVSNHISAYRLRQLHKTLGRASPYYRTALEDYLSTRTARSSFPE
jgi:hypothetical protein